MKEEKTCGCTRDEALENLPGAAIDAADNDKVDEEAIKERTTTLGFNPRNSDDKMPG